MDPTIAPLLGDIAMAPRIAVVVDVDAIDAATAFRRGVMIRALDALAHAGVHLVLWSRVAVERAARLHRAIPRSWWLDVHDPAGAIVTIRDRLPDVRIVAITDDAGLRAALGRADRVIPVATRERVIPAACWWLVEARGRLGSSVTPPRCRPSRDTS
jgi:hypothetical protein